MRYCQTKRKSKIVNFSPTPTVVTMKLGSNAQSATNYTLSIWSLTEQLAPEILNLIHMNFKNSPKFSFQKNVHFILLLSSSHPPLHHAQISLQSEHQLQKASCPKFSTKPEIVKKTVPQKSSVFRKTFENLAIDVLAKFNQN